jgi:hypothetical protein
MKSVERKYNMPNADLAMFTSNLVVTMRRDATEFDGRGISSAVVDALEALGNSFEVFPTDDYYVGAIQIAVSNKNSFRLKCMHEIQHISGYFEQKWGLSSGEYKQLRISNLQRMTDNNYLVACRSVVAVAGEYFSALSPLGLDQADIDGLSADAQSFEDKLNIVADKKKLRDSKATERNMLGNDIYRYVTEYCRIGKLIWENTDPSKYNDYIIYKKSSDLPGKVMNLSFDNVSGLITWDMPSSPEPIGSFQLEMSVNESDWTVLYDGPDKEFSPALPAGTSYWRCRAHSTNGYGAWSDTLAIAIS